MEIQARTKSISMDYETGDTLITFATELKPAEIEEEWQTLKAKDLIIKAEVDRNDRSSAQNRYFHKLVGLIASKQKESFASVKNNMITSYGQIETDEGGLPIEFWLSQSYEEIKNATLMHLLVDDVRQIDDMELLHVWKFRGSHTLNTAEFADLLSGTIAEAEALGIPTVTEAELEFLLGGSYEKRTTKR